MAGVAETPYAGLAGTDNGASPLTCGVTDPAPVMALSADRFDTVNGFRASLPARLVSKRSSSRGNTRNARAATVNTTTPVRIGTATNRSRKGHTAAAMMTVAADEARIAGTPALMAGRTLRGRR